MKSKRATKFDGREGVGDEVLELPIVFLQDDTGQVVTKNIIKQQQPAKSCPVSYRTINQYGGPTYRPCFSRVNPNNIGCGWTDEFDFNAPLV